ncbi:hypothetical protein FRC10_009912 [Ceratobasidium sp. 414]|nr:hypothetical protein FRC10_009912 [Ceratobasidium sp. 414]
MPLKSRLNVDSDDEQEYAQVAASSKMGKRSRQIVDDGSDSDHAPPAKRRTPSATKIKSHANLEPEQPDEEVDIEASDSDAPAPPRQGPDPRNDDDDDVVDTSSSRLSSPDPSPARKQPAPKPERASRSKPSRIESDDEDPKPPSPTPALKPPRAPIRQDSVAKPLRKPVGAGSRAKEREKEAAPGTVPAIPRRPKDALAAVKDTQDMDLLNKDVYNQLFNTSSSSKPIAKNAQTEAKQKEINAKRQAAKSALLNARESTFDLQLPTDKVLAFEASFLV